MYLQFYQYKVGCSVRFEWDPTKAAVNLSKHGVAFEDAVLVFEDPLQRSRQDRHLDGEERWQTLCMVCSIVLLLVAHTWRDDGDDEVTRIISARRATKQERRDYEQGR
jgi:uncharacterized DUF497 family protein